MKFRSSPWLASCVLVLCALGCGSGDGKPVTEVVLRIDTTLNTPCDFDSIDVDLPWVDGGTGQPVQFGAADMKKLPVQITFVKKELANFDVTVKVMKDGAVVAAQPVSLSFVDGKSMLAKVNIGSMCGESCDPKTPTLEAYAPPSYHAAPSDCTVDPGDCDPKCTGSQDCVNGICRDQPVVRYKVAMGQTGFRSTSCDAGGKTVLGPVGPLSDEEQVVEVDLPSAGNPINGADFDVLFFGRKVTKMWVSTRGWVAFSDTKPEVPATGFSLDDANLPAGIYAFADDIKYGNSASICFAPIEETGVIVSWNSMCFQETGCDAGDKLKFSIAIERPLPSASGFASKVGLVHVFFLPPHGSVMAWDRAMKGGDADGGPTIGVKDFSKANCAPAQCNTNGLCTTNGKPCGFTWVADPSVYFAQSLTEGSPLSGDTAEEILFSAVSN